MEPILGIVNLPELATPISSPLVVISLDQISFLQIIQVSPEIICDLNSTSLEEDIIIMSIFNTTNCEHKNEGMLGICQTWIPYHIKISGEPMEKKTALLILLTIIIILVCVGLFCIGCGFQQVQVLRVSIR